LEPAVEFWVFGCDCAVFEKPRLELREMETTNENVTPRITQWRRRWAPSLTLDPAALLRILGRSGTPIIEGATIHFVYYNRQARQATITGELNDWDRTGVTLPMSPLGRTGVKGTLLLSSRN
jgi:hypothetical protein